MRWLTGNLLKYSFLNKAGFFHRDGAAPGGKGSLQDTRGERLWVRKKDFGVLPLIYRPGRAFVKGRYNARIPRPAPARRAGSSHLATIFPTAPGFSSRMASSITVTTGDAKIL